MTIHKSLASTMAVVMVASSISPVIAATTSNESLIGKNRTETSIKISKDGWKSAETVILVNDSAIPDALTATPLAHAKNAPILLTGKGGLNKETANEIKRLGAKNIIMIGGDKVLPSKIEKDLKALNVKIDRIKGATREETALAIAKRLDGIKDVSEITVVNGTTGLADAVSIAAAAAEKGMPILLANPKSGLSVAEKFIKDESIKSSFIIGGKTVLPEKLVASLPSKQRIEGSNRNDTNAKVIEKFYADRNLDNLYLAKDGMGDSGQLIDALAVGALAAKNGAPVLIASKKLSETQKKVINTKRVDTITQVGGNGNEKAFSELKEIEKETVYKVKNEAELQEALKKADANDIIELESSATISNDVSIKTDNAVDVVLKGDCTGKVTVETPNANIENSGNIGTLVVENGKNTTVTNTSSGKIDKVEVDSSSENVKLENNGKIDKIENNASGTNIENNGTISNLITGTTTPNIEGNKPGGGSSSGGTVIPSIGVESIKITGVKPIEVGSSLKLNADISPSNATNKVVSWSSSDDKIATVDSDGNVKAIAKGEVNITASCGGKSETVKVYVAEKLITEAEGLKNAIQTAEDGDTILLGEGIISAGTIDLSGRAVNIIGVGDATDITGTTFSIAKKDFKLSNVYSKGSTVSAVSSSGFSANVNIENVTFKDCKASPVMLHTPYDKDTVVESPNFSINNATIEMTDNNNSTGIALWNQWNDVKIDNVNIETKGHIDEDNKPRVPGRMIQVKGAKSLQLLNSNFVSEENYGTRYAIMYGSPSGERNTKFDRVLIENNKFKNQQTAIQHIAASGCDKTYINNNKFENTPFGGIRFGTFPTSVSEKSIQSKVTISNNEFTKSNSDAITQFSGVVFTQNSKGLIEYKNVAINNNNFLGMNVPLNTNKVEAGGVDLNTDEFKIFGNTGDEKSNIIQNLW